MLDKAKTGIDKAMHHLESEFGKLQLGRANPSIVEDIMIEQYGSMQPIKNSASINILDSQTLSIAPWDKDLIHVIAKAITDGGTGLNPQTMADSVMIKMPAMTEERRKDMVKIVKKMSEEAKVSVRNSRSDSLKAIKNALAAKEISEDAAKDLESELQDLVNDANKKVEEAAKRKEEDVMKV